MTNCLRLPLYSTAIMPPLAAIKTEAKNPNELSPVDARRVDANLAAWFQEFNRPFHFRETRDPYKIMVSEFMLQQTTVAAVEPYYARFIQRFPTVHTLAAATEDEVMSFWAGLGYYRRARQLHSSAIVLVDVYNGQFPHTVSELQKLPGFGRYTAGAVVSQAFDLPGAIVEANTVRVFARLAGVHGMTGEAHFMKALWKVSEDLVSKAASPRIFNQAAMELGSVVCRQQPLCNECPVREQCVAYRHGVADIIVEKRPRRENVAVDTICIAIRDPLGQYAVRRIPKGKWHAGMWEFPAERADESEACEQATPEAILSLFGFILPNIMPFVTLRYQVTHHKVACHIYHCQIDRITREKLQKDAAMQFLGLNDISALPMGSAQKKLLLLLTEFNILENQ